MPITRILRIRFAFMWQLLKLWSIHQNFDAFGMVRRFGHKTPQSDMNEKTARSV